ncbi:hypothetical protein M514_03732 [Trichuris suis]|uniref:Uncharacterized protein n=1 Tax=Trichuris suis TaxID=68888 RepID=A0A085NGX2_9BILA|nr:hypothetical protein M513_03732 [Trichuris suis]KFD68718.1 hypothetical protein M514_03732 [Trichuris suis]
MLELPAEIPPTDQPPNNQSKEVDGRCCDPALTNQKRFATVRREVPGRRRPRPISCACGSSLVTMRPKSCPDDSPVSRSFFLSSQPLGQKQAGRKTGAITVGLFDCSVP